MNGNLKRDFLKLCEGSPFCWLAAASRFGPDESTESSPHHSQFHLSVRR